MADVDSRTVKSLLKAARVGNVEEMRRLIEGGACINAVDEKGKTALIIIAHKWFRPSEFEIKSLIMCGIDVNVKDKDDKTALMYCIDREMDRAALAIIKHSKDLDVNIVDNRGRTALMRAASYFRLCTTTKVCLAIIERGADVNVKDKEGNTALMHAIDKEKEDIAFAIIERSKDLDFNIADNQGQTALMYAITQIRNENIALAIIEDSKDLDWNAVDNKRQTALMKAAIHGKRRVVHELIKRGADVNVKDKEGKTALMHAIDKEKEDIAFAIIEHSKDLDFNIADNQKQTALMRAVRSYTKVDLALIKRGADVNVKDKDCKTALMHAIDGGKKDTALAIIEHSKDLDLNAVDNHGQTALMKAAIHGKRRVVHELFKRGADVNMKDIEGKTALFYAFLEPEFFARCLMENGVDLQLKDKFNVSMLTYYIYHSHTSSKKELYDKFRFLKENGIKRKTIINEIFHIVFCKLPLSFTKIPGNVFSKKVMLSLLLCAADLSKERSSFTRTFSKRKTLFEDLSCMMDKVDTDMTLADLSTALGTLLDHGVDPNTCDEKGNNIFHNIFLLGLYNHSDESVFDMFRLVAENGLKAENMKNFINEELLHFMLSNATSLAESSLNMEFIVNMCQYLLQNDSKIAEHISSSGESVFHLLIKLSRLDDAQEESFQQYLLELLKLFKTHIAKQKVAINRGDDEMNTPLHVWAASPAHGLSAEILDFLLRSGAVLHVKNMKGETPLHVCRTWTAVKLLVEAGAKTNDEDASGRSPLLSAANNSLFLDTPGCFYPDVSPSEAPAFWRTVMDMGFDLWTCEKNGDSIISNLIKGNSFALADALIQVACDNSKKLSVEIFLGVLNAICKDDSTQITWKSILIDKLLKQLKSTRRLLDMSVPLRSCCKNITKTSELDSIHYEIAKQFLRYGASGESCLDVAERFPALHKLLSTPICLEERPFVIPWLSHSQKHKNQLAEVARGLNCNDVGPYWYHNVRIGSGAFGEVFVGIHKNDSMEVAIKRVQSSLQDRQEDIREIRNFASITDCKYIVRYLGVISQPNHSSFIILELMEGNLDEYFASTFYDHGKSTKLCKDIALGLKYLHNEKNIIHRDLKPGNILFKTHPEVCLKIADFGLSRRLDIDVTSTVIATGVGTRGWIAPEVINSATHTYLKSSDVFSFGLILHYILSNQKHPFSPADCSGKNAFQINMETESNILNSKMDGWDDSLDPEASHLIRGMLNCTNEKDRPTASVVSDHPMFWSKKKKLDFLSAVGNQEEFECPRAKRTAPLTVVEQDLEKKFATIVKFGKWDDPRYTQTSKIIIEMQKPIVKHDKKGKPYTVPTRKYDIGSVVELVRFIRNAVAHVSEASRPASVSTQILEGAVFLDEFPSLVIEVFKVVTKHGWDVDREEIKHVLVN